MDNAEKYLAEMAARCTPAAVELMKAMYPPSHWNAASLAQLAVGIAAQIINHSSDPRARE